MPRAGAPTVDDAFGVIAHPLRRELLQRLAVGEARVSGLASLVPVSRPAVSEYLRLMLGRAWSSSAARVARYYSLRRERLGDVDRWLARLDEFWADGLRRLGEHLDARA